jgi:hypothetical protein
MLLVESMVSSSRIKKLSISQCSTLEKDINDYEIRMSQITRDIRGPKKSHLVTIPQLVDRKSGTESPISQT